MVPAVGQEGLRGRNCLVTAVGMFFLCNSLSLSRILNSGVDEGLEGVFALIISFL